MWQIDWLTFAHLKFFSKTHQFFTIWDLPLAGNSNVGDKYYCDIACLEKFTFKSRTKYSLDFTEFSTNFTKAKNLKVNTFWQSYLKLRFFVENCKNAQFE